MLSEGQRTLMTLILQKKSAQAIGHLKANPTMDVNFIVSMPQHKLYHFTPLMMAASSAQPEVLLALLQRKANVLATDLGGKTALHYAVGGGESTKARTEVINRLTQANKDLLTIADHFGNMPIHIAALHSTKDRYSEGLLNRSQTYTPALTQFRNYINKEEKTNNTKEITQKFKNIKLKSP